MAFAADQHDERYLFVNWFLLRFAHTQALRARQVRNIRNETLPAGRDLENGEIYALVEACKADGSPAGSRDATILGVLYTCGIRRAEWVSLDLADFDNETGRLTNHQGKGRKDRTVYVTGGTVAALRLWLVQRGTEPRALFPSVQKGGAIQLRRMTTQAIYNGLKKRANQAGVSCICSCTDEF